MSLLVLRVEVLVSLGRFPVCVEEDIEFMLLKSQLPEVYPIVLESR